MARISVEDCLAKVSNRFALVSLAAARTKQLYKGSRPRVKSENKEVVVSLREVAVVCDHQRGTDDRPVRNGGVRDDP